MHAPPGRSASARRNSMSENVPVLVDVAYVRAHPEVRLVDVRWAAKGPPGRSRYLEGHIPGAVYIDLEDELSPPRKGAAGRHPWPETDAFEAALGRAGIGAATHVVAYDDVQLAFAGRLWFM